ncbi:MAG: class I SAM-dependent methyltransferase [candidate division WOR-3 bacterium]|nr:MAG: class I SAM-dependent methyltransferase [candidate division WOR-3 bacterium]
MDSQSGYCLPVIYEPFNANDRAHWRDRGSCFDFLYTAGGEDKRLLDFGPGDGWPSLIVAPFVNNIIGVDGSQRRVDVCNQNAKRLGIKNVAFTYTTPGAPLPFGDETFDGVMAASSIEQTPDPFNTLQELHRVLKKGGRFRIDYESLGRYQGGREQVVYIDDGGTEKSTLILYDRDIERETAAMYKICFTMNEQSLKRHFSDKPCIPEFTDVTIDKLRQVADRISDARMCTLIHPSGRTLVQWLGRIGFREVLPTYSGAWFAGQLYDVLPPSRRPSDLRGVDERVQPGVQIVVAMAAPIEQDPMITAVK